MYSNEIDTYLKRKNFSFDLYSEIEEIMKSSPQLYHVKLNRVDEEHGYYTIRSRDNYNWDISIRNYNIGECE